MAIESLKVSVSCAGQRLDGRIRGGVGADQLVVRVRRESGQQDGADDQEDRGQDDGGERTGGGEGFGGRHPLQATPAIPGSALGAAADS